MVAVAALLSVFGSGLVDAAEAASTASPGRG
jgi:hypothetical protein